MKTIETLWTCRLHLLVICGCGLLPALASAQASAAATAGDSWITVTITDAEGAQVTIDTTPGAYADVVAPPADSAEDSFDSFSGTFLDAGFTAVQAVSSLPVEDLAFARSAVSELVLSIAGAAGIVAEQVEVGAKVNGPCGGELTAFGSTSLLEASTTGDLIPEVSIQPNPEPNTEIVDDNGVRIVVNEQSLTGDGVADLRLSVSGVHVYLAQVPFGDGGEISGGAILGYADVELECPPDTDGDGVGDSDDNCMKTPNPDQADSDGDGVGNACEGEGGPTGSSSG